MSKKLTAKQILKKAATIIRNGDEFHACIAIKVAADAYEEHTKEYEHAMKVFRKLFKPKTATNGSPFWPVSEDHYFAQGRVTVSDKASRKLRAAALEMAAELADKSLAEIGTPNDW